MNQIFHPINDFINRLVKRETDPINSARVKILINILVIYLPYTVILSFAYFIGGEFHQLVRSVIAFTVCWVLLAVINFYRVWKVASHIALCALTLVVWSNISFYVHGINVATLQYIWFVSALSFYMHGLKWGWFYSSINVIPALAYLAIDNHNYFFLSSGPYEVSKLSYLLVTTFNFLCIIYMHYYFIKSFNLNFANLTTAKKELNELNNKLEITLTDLQQSTDARMAFLSTMSHELRTPLNGVIGISNALLLQNPREDQEENLAVLKFSAENLLLLINDVLDFNKFDADKVLLERIEFNLEDLIKNNYASLKLKAREKMLDLNLSITDDLKGKVVLSDPTRLNQVLMNLLNNALKFTESGSVTLQVNTIDLTDREINIRFIVEDTGIGIDPEKQHIIFEPFAQASSSTNRKYGGTGLGLPIVKNVLTMFDSSINMESTIGVGTKFFFDIRFQYQLINGEVDCNSVNLESTLTDLRVLVAEDNPVNILVIKKTLEQWNVTPVIAENGAIALEKLAVQDFDVVLMDLYMPELDGYQTAIAIRKLSDKGKANIPIIALTATVSNNIAEKVLEVGMNDYLAKPFDPKILFAKLQRINASIGVL